MGILSRLASVLLVLAGCTIGPETVDAPLGPGAPSLTTSPVSPGGTLKPLLTGEAAPGSTVRVFAAPDCAGTPLLTLPAQQLADGVRVDIVQGAQNVFSAMALRAEGGASGCSEPLVYRYDPSLVPDQPQLAQTVPASPAPERRPLVVGWAPRGTLVRLYLTSACVGPVVAQVSPEGLAIGVPVVMAANTLTVLSADVLDPTGAISGCSAPLEYEHDDHPPDAPVIFGSVPASPSSVLLPSLEFMAQEAGLDRLRVFYGRDCRGFSFEWPDQCGGLCVTMIQVTAAWGQKSFFSAQAVDRAGNVSDCGPTFGYLQDPTMSVAAPQLFLGHASGTVSGMVWEIDGSSAYGTRTDFFLTPGCAGPPFASVEDFGYWYSPVFYWNRDVEPFTVSARSFMGATASHCSQPVSWP